MNIYTITIAISILVYIAIGNYAGRGIKNLDDYYVAGRKAPTLIIVGTLIASVLSSTMFLGEAGFAYETQAGPYVLFPQFACAGYVLGAIFFGRYLRRSRTTTVAEFFGRRFDSTRVQALAGFTIIFALSGYLLAVTQGAAILLSGLTELSYIEALVVGWLSYTLFTMYSGSRGVILTDTVMFLLFTVASLAAIVFLVQNYGGWPAIIEGLVVIEGKEELMSWHGIVGPGTEFPTAMDYLIWAIVIDVSWMLVYAVSPWQSSRHLMAKNEHVVLRSATIACLLLALMQVMVYGMGGVINLGKPDIEPPEGATIWASLNLFPEFLGALMLAGIMAAILSSASTFLSLVGFSVSNDIGIHKSGDEAKILRFTRLIMLVSWGPVGLMSIWSKRITESAAFWGMLSGLVFNVVPKFFDFIGMIALPSWLNPVIIGCVASLIVTIAVSRRTSVRATEAAYLAKLHVTPEEELDRGKARTTLVPAAILIANGIIAPFLLIRYYVRPFQRATGTLLADGSLDWFTGEVALALSWSVVYISLGVFAIRFFRKAYSPAV
jgi:sodium/pantothenate symporter